MALPGGSRLGPYEILTAVGAGGMGEVYRARDTRLDRTVAIKILPATLADDPHFRERFDREARAISQLAHPHICTLYDVGEASALSSETAAPSTVRFLVMEHLEGETLEGRLKKGALPLDQALKIAIDIADALDKAHRAGITHRDVKPANIMLTKTGAGSTSAPHAKLLDFGLAKLRGPAGPISMSGMTRLATVGPFGGTQGVPNTAHGTILGTVQYMAPEQVEGREADARSDIWALGAVIYEMVTGTRPFSGDSPASIIGSILKDTPPPISARQPLSPPALDHIVNRCLDKDPEERWQSAADLMRELRWTMASYRTAAASPVRSSSGRSSRLGWVVAAGLALAVVALSAWVARSHVATDAPSLRLSVLPPPNTLFASSRATVPNTELAVSPDGRLLVFVAQVASGNTTLWVRPFNGVAAQQLAGTEDAEYPFWSPDSRSIAFFAQGKLKRMDVAGGPVQLICDVADPRGGTWGAGNVILFTFNVASIYRVSANGGVPTSVTTVDPKIDTDHRWPSFLPDGRHFLFLRRTPALQDYTVEVASIDGGDRTRLFRSQYGAQYVPSGHILFLANGILMAQPFDAAARKMTGEPVPLAQDVGGSSVNYGSFSASNTGLLAYAGAFSGRTQLTMFARSGDILTTMGPPDDYADVRFSSDNRRVAVSRADSKSNAGHISLVDVASGLFSPLTFGPGINSSPVWSPDDRDVFFRSNRVNPISIYRRLASGAGSDELVFRNEGEFRLSSGGNVFPTDVSPDGKFLLFHAASAALGFDIWALPLKGDRIPRPVVRSPAADVDGRFSPDGRFIAYTTDESGRSQVVVQTFPETGGRWQVSVDGGFEPRWRADGRELYFIGPDRRLMVAPVQTGSTFEHWAPSPLFTARVPGLGNPFRTNYSVTRDGQRFLIKTVADNATPTAITVVSNWLDSLKK